MSTFYTRLHYWTQHRPEHLFLTEIETGQSFTYQQSTQAVQCLCQHLGSSPQTIFLQFQNSILNALVWLSAFAGGHVLLPLAPDLSERDIARATEMFHPDIVFVEQASHGAQFEASGARVVTREECEVWLTQPLARPNRLPTPPQEGRICIMTSGTTGEPKGVVLTEQQVAWTADQVRLVHRLGPQDRGLTPLPFFHINAPVVSLCASLLAGASLVIARRFSRRQFWTWLEQQDITWASLVPAMIAILLEGDPPPLLPSTLRFVRTGSAPLPAAHLARFEEYIGVPVIETYGLSEAASMIVANPLPPEFHKPGSAGRPAGVSLRICKPATQERRLHDVAPGEVGEICIQGPNVIQAYYGDAGQEAFVENWFRTGDLGYLDRDGYLFLVGRLRAVINRGGENIAPREIEEVLQAHPAVRESVAIGRPHPIYGEEVVAYLALNEPQTRQLEEDLWTHVRRHLRPPKTPVDLIILDALPKNRMGKVDRQQLKLREETMTCGANVNAC
ncbi:AMP-binding protein [Ktedonobacter robiniae]|uniref:AMP-dependent ligase n=1 Tax=Ktedonobacter robiniae TaxID=2778365 RepID=A0ABQ3UGV8_9CHLR|nr:AMP-binding protein [Ktedonobacter robiniae]GHO51932.1 AMP-dependent ligase [Ktedonobacter robiniae]